MARQHQHVAAPCEDELRQSDLSHLRLQEMSPEQRAELRRRYNDFIRHFGRSGNAAACLSPIKPRRLHKWVPGAKR